MKPLAQISAVVILLLLTLSTKAQKYTDYVITVQGDTLPCTISELGWVHNGNYKTDQMKHKKQILLSEIKEYYALKENVVYRKVYKRANKPKSAEFMPVLENGKINLYEEVSNTSMTLNNPSSVTQWFIAKRSDTGKVIKNSDISLGTLFFKSKEKRVNEFVEMIKDNKEVYDKFLADEKFSFKQIRNLIHLYNTGKPYVPPTPPVSPGFVIED